MIGSTQATWVTAGLAAVALACGAEGPRGSQPDAGPVAIASDAGEDAAGDAAVTMVRDRCLSGDCAPVALPEQPELAFMKDMGDGWHRLMEMDWTLSPASEGYRCMAFTVPENLQVVAFYPRSPLGTHHSAFGIDTQPTRPDGYRACSSAPVGARRLPGSGAGTEPFAFPEGVGMPIEQGSQIHMNLHLFNLSDEVLRGRSGIWVKVVEADAIEFEAEDVLAGSTNLEVPPGRSTHRSVCTLWGDTTLFSLGPHMHQLGVSTRVIAHTAEGEQVLHDGAYDFYHQISYMLEPFSLAMGDRIEVECTYENDRGRTVYWGDGSLEEMCFVSLGLYPGVGYGTFPCFE